MKEELEKYVAELEELISEGLTTVETLVEAEKDDTESRDYLDHILTYVSVSERLKRILNGE